VNGPGKSQANRAEATMKRFWKKVELEDSPSQLGGDAQLVVKLDNRPLKTPGGNPLFLPTTKRLAASLIAQEWDSQDKLIKPHALPMTSLVSRAIDGLREGEQRTEVQKALLKYLDTDTICFHEDRPPALVRLQEEHWNPLLDKMRTTYGVKIEIIQSIFSSGQPQETKRLFRSVVAEFDEWKLAAFERSVYTTKSFLIALALVQRHISVDQASIVAHVEVLSQIERWGEVEDTHDVDYRDVRRQLGSAACLLVDV